MTKFIVGDKLQVIGSGYITHFFDIGEEVVVEKIFILENNRIEYECKGKYYSQVVSEDALNYIEFKVGDYISIDFGNGRWENGFYYGMTEAIMNKCNIYRILAVCHDTESYIVEDVYGMEWYIPFDTVYKYTDNVDWGKLKRHWTNRRYPIYTNKEEREEFE